MAYLAVNKNGTEKIFDQRPRRGDDMGRGIWFADLIYKTDFGITLPRNSIIALTGRKITFEDEPIKI